MWFGIPVAEAGGWVLFILLALYIVTAVIRGDLVPRKTHEDEKHNTEMWRAAHMISEQARQEEREQKQELLSTSKLMAAVMRALPVPTQNEDNDVVQE